ncbi:MAG: glycosyltransferase [Pseudomonadota bacterium]|nr:glycosyltransferase [Pseudomonadota bacterium]
MNLVLFTHPNFLGSQSHQHFARMLVRAYQRQGHTVELRQPEAVLRQHIHGRAAKWAGYVDQYIVFPWRMRRRIAADPAHTLYVFCDQALGPWMPLVARRPHVVHCHDLLALRSALGDVPENPTSWTGRIYQRYIRAGFRHARHFISVSQKSRADLQLFGGVQPLTSEVVYNGLNHPYRRQSTDVARANLQRTGLPAPAGFLLHIGGGQWYKNPTGVLHLYAHYVARRVAAGQPVLPLWMVSPSPSASLQAVIDDLPQQGTVRFFQKLDTDAIEALYSLAAALIFPSLAEGFGWPIAEGLACGCPVITTGEAPMNEVGGPHAHYLPLLLAGEGISAWADHGVDVLCGVLDRPAAERDAAARAGVEWARQFDPQRAIESYLTIYQSVLSMALPTDRAKAPT